jgi:hypothetical protein
MGMLMNDGTNKLEAAKKAVISALLPRMRPPDRLGTCWNLWQRIDAEQIYDEPCLKKKAED